MDLTGAAPPSRVIHLVPPQGGGVDRCVRDLLRHRPDDWILHVAAAQCVLERPAQESFEPWAPDELIAHAAAGGLGAVRALHVHSTVAEVRTAAARLAAATSAPILLTLHDIWFADPACPAEERAQRLAFVRTAAARTAPSDFIVQHLQTAAGEPLACMLIPNGSDPLPADGSIELPPPGSAERHASGEHGFAVAVIGALGDHKGLRALEALAPLLPDGLRIVVLGYTERQLLPGWAVEGRVWVHGVFEPEQLPALVRRYQVRLAFFPPGVPESFSYALSDAWSSGLPVLAPDHGAIAERVRLHGGGALYPPQADVPQIAQRLAEQAQAAVRQTPDRLLRSPLPTTAQMAQAFDGLYAGLPPFADGAAAAAAADDFPRQARAQLDGRFFRLEILNLQARLQAQAEVREALERQVAALQARPAPLLLDVVIVVYRPRLAELQAGLQAIAQACVAGSIVTVHLWHNDEGPQATPGLAAAVDELRAAGVAVRAGGSRGNLGFGRAINAVLPDVAAPYLLLLNQDAIPEPAALQRLWDSARGDDANVAAWELRQIPYEHPKDYDPVTGDTGWCSGAAVLLRTAALREVGGFEPRFFMYCEDVDLSWRLRCRGWRLRYLPRCAVVHRTYREAGEIKPLAVLGGAFANLCLRTRFAGRRSVLDGLRQLWREIRGPQAFAGCRRGLLLAGLKFLRHYAYFRRTRAAGPGFEPCLRGWDYEQRREGAFHPFLSQAEQAQPRPLVSVLLRPEGSDEDLLHWLRGLESQTHRPLQTVVIDDGRRPGLRALCEPWQAALAIEWATVPPGTPLAAVAAHVVRGDWVLLAEDARHRLYADHVEVLLQTAIDRRADAACGLVWQIDAPAGQARDAHRLHAERRLSTEPPSARPSRLVRCAALLDDPAPAAAEAAKLTALRYADDASA
jgi:glycosyltransferase involved in cell wall biosynthesis